MAKHCSHCDIDFTNPTCPRCGRPASVPPVSDEVSEVPGMIEDMVVKASRPSLASLVKAGVRKGLIQIHHDYATRKTSAG